MNTEQEDLKKTMIQIQEELREAKDIVETITDLKRKVEDHDKRLKVVESRDRGLQVPVGRRNPSVESEGYGGSRENSSSNLPQQVNVHVLGPDDVEKKLLTEDPEEETN